MITEDGSETGVAEGLKERATRQLVLVLNTVLKRLAGYSWISNI